MGRQANKCPKKCSRHLFSLKPVHYSAFFSRESQFLYCPDNLKTQKNIPKFNRDKKHYTAAFILAADQLKLIENDQVYQIEHERFKRQNHEQKTQILMPKPRSKVCYCNICKQIYQDYRQHISSLKHKETIKESQFNIDIIGLCRGFGNNAHRLPRAILTQELPSTTSKMSDQTEGGFQNQKQKHSHLQFEQPELFVQKSTKYDIDVLSFHKSVKSFQNYAQNQDIKEQKGTQNDFLQHTVNKEMNENCFMSHYGGFKFVQQTASPVKTKLQRPIILIGRSFVFDK